MVPPSQLLAYRKSLDAVEACEEVARAVVFSRADLADQLRRAAASVPLNVMEGAREFSSREKARFYRIARRSAGECEAVLDVVDRVFDRPPPTAAARAAISEAIALITRLAQSVDRSARS